MSHVPGFLCVPGWVQCCDTRVYRSRLEGSQLSASSAHPSPSPILPTAGRRTIHFPIPHPSSCTHVQPCVCMRVCEHNGFVNCFVVDVGRPVTLNCKCAQCSLDRHMFYLPTPACTQVRTVFQLSACPVTVLTLRLPWRMVVGLEAAYPGEPSSL